MIKRLQLGKMVTLKCNIIKQLYEGKEVQSVEDSPRKQYNSYERDKIMSGGAVKNQRQRTRMNLMSEVKRNLTMMNSTFNQKGHRNISGLMQSRDTTF